MKEILKLIRKADEDYHLIENKDRIIIGVSGGKDSIVLLYALTIYQKFKEKNFEIIPVHMNMGFENADITPIVKFCNSLNIPLHIIDVPIYEILLNYKKEDGTLDCSRCSNLKRGAIINIAKEFNANKVAFAHHGDDAIETLFMNMIQSAKMDTFKPSIYYEDNNITFIRPLVYVKESLIIHLMNKYDLISVESKCPKDKNSFRETIKKQLNDLYKLNPNARNNFIKMLSTSGLWKKS